ncbi:MAG TPA: hypothetical protein VLH39_01650, partial [Magnetospirillaceae bacterium]|nr:hypothetical protein [Magnetospirillaceae bacterium]
MIKKSAVAAVFLLAAAFARGQGGGVPPPVPFLPPEAPESLLSLEIGGSDVDLVAQGYWEVSVLASAAMGLGGNVGVSAPTLLFRQVPDLWLSLTVLDRWFLEASLTAEGFGGEYVAGYRGGEGDFLREVRLGNKGVSFPDLPYIALGVGTSTSFGVSALGSGVGGSAHFLLRYDQARRVTQIWVGGREVTRLEYRPSEYARGRWFLLPDQIIVDLELYVETSGGILTGSDGRTYRRMRSDEYSLSAATGRLDLKTAVGKDRRLLAYYSSMTIPTAGTESAPPFYGRAPATVENVAAGPALILYEEGVHEGFLIANRYALPSSVRPESASAYVRTSATGLPDIGFDAVVLPDGFVRVTRAGADSSRPSRDEYRMPFLGTDLDMAWLYDPEATQAAEGPPLRPEPAYSRILVVETYGTTGSLVLEEAGVLAGSVEVLRNGVPEYGFTYDPVSNIVTLERAPGVSDTIEISYLLATADRGAGSLAAGLGGIFDLSPNWRAWAALGLRWGVPGTGYSAGGDVLPGSLVLTAGFRGGSMEPAAPDGPGPAHRLLAEAALAGSYRRPDAAGWHRIAGMEENAAWTSPFRPTGAWPPNAAISAV